jgi:predicted dinucleotide-binding enzyme
MEIGIIGAGFVGENLAKALSAKGHDVIFGVRNQHSPKVEEARAALGPKVRFVSVKEAAAASDMVALTIPWSAVEDVVAHVGDWQGKIVIDAINRFGPNPPDSAGSAGQDLARLAQGARVVKAFNTIGAEHYNNSVIGGEKVDLYICGDDAEAKAAVGQLASELGFEVVDVGPLSAATHTENFAKFWVHLARNVTGRDVAFKLLRG